MIRRQPLETKINHERWLISYADFITLLFAFFVVMYSVSQVNESKYKMLSQTLQQTFSSSSVNTENINNDASQINETNPIAQLTDIQNELEQALQGILSEGSVSINGNEQWVDISIDASALFLSGKSAPSKKAHEALSKVADVLAPFSNAIAVAGHTDDVPISNKEFGNNWELSAARAVSVVNILAFSGVNPQRLSAVGYGEYHPVADNTTATGREKNRRVVLRVAKQKALLPQIKLEKLQSQIASSEATNTANPENDTTTQSVDEINTIQNTTNSVIEPVKLKNGGLLFTSDPNADSNTR